MSRGHVVGEGGAHCDFHSFECIHDQQAQSPVEYIEVKQIVEPRPWPEGVVSSGLSEGDRVGDRR